MSVCSSRAEHLVVDWREHIWLGRLRAAAFTLTGGACASAATSASPLGAGRHRRRGRREAYSFHAASACERRAHRPWCVGGFAQKDNRGHMPGSIVCMAYNAYAELSHLSIMLTVTGHLPQCLLPSTQAIELEARLPAPGESEGSVHAVPDTAAVVDGRGVGSASETWRKPDHADWGAFLGESRGIGAGAWRRCQWRRSLHQAPTRRESLSGRACRACLPLRLCPGPPGEGVYVGPVSDGWLGVGDALPRARVAGAKMPALHACPGPLTERGVTSVTVTIEQWYNPRHHGALTSTTRSCTIVRWLR